MTFNGVVIITDAQGGIIPHSFERGIINRRKEFVEMARGDGQLVKHFAKTGTSHSIDIEFFSVTQSQLSTRFTAMQALADMTAMGTLKINSPQDSVRAEIANCVVDSVTPIAQEHAFIPSANYATNYTITPVWHLSFSLKFQQLK